MTTACTVRVYGTGSRRRSGSRHVRFLPYSSEPAPIGRRRAERYEMAHTMIGLGLDVLSLLVLVGWLYRRRVAAPEMTMVFAALNIGLFAAVVAIGSNDFPPGVRFAA